MSVTRQAFAAAMIALLSLPHVAFAVDFTLATLLDENSVPAPSNPALITLFEQSSFHGDQVLSVASGSFQELIGAFQTPLDSSPTTLFTGSTIDPNTGNPIGALVYPQGDGTNLLTSASSEQTGGGFSIGIYDLADAPTTMGTIVASGGTLPGLSDVIQNVGLNRYSVGSGNLAYWAYVDADEPTERVGLFLTPLSGGSTDTLVDTNTAVPDTPGEFFTELHLGRAGYDGQTTAFRGHFPSGRGIYTVGDDPGYGTVIAQGDELPGTALSTFYTLDTSPAIDGDDVVFGASQGLGGRGIYARLDNVLTVIADTDTPLPQNPAETFTGFSIGSVAVNAGYALNNGRVAFEASGSDGSNGIYLYDQGEISVVIKSGDQIGGLDFYQADITEGSLNGNRIVMDVILADFVNEIPYGRVMVASAGLAGDFNGDGSVDAADYAVWRNGYGDQYGLDDYHTWRENYGATSGPAATPFLVPEPLALTLSAAGIACLALGRRRYRVSQTPSLLATRV